MILVDTSVWIDLFAGHETPHVSTLESAIVSGEDLCICGLVLTEVLQGIRDDKDHTRTNEVLSRLLYLPMERETFMFAADIYRGLRARGITIRNSVDCMIAAVCIEHGAALLHNDRDFARIASQFDLVIIDVSPQS